MELLKNNMVESECSKLKCGEVRRGGKKWWAAAKRRAFGVGAASNACCAASPRTSCSQVPYWDKWNVYKNTILRFKKVYEFFPCYLAVCNKQISVKSICGGKIPSHAAVGGVYLWHFSIFFASTIIAKMSSKYSRVPSFITTAAVWAWVFLTQ